MLKSQVNSPLFVTHSDMCGPSYVSSNGFDISLLLSVLNFRYLTCTNVLNFCPFSPLLSMRLKPNSIRQSKPLDLIMQENMFLLAFLLFCQYMVFSTNLVVIVFLNKMVSLNEKIVILLELLGPCYFM